MSQLRRFAFGVLLVLVLVVGMVTTPLPAQAGEPMFWWRISWAQADPNGKMTTEELWSETPTTVYESVKFGVQHTGRIATLNVGQDVLKLRYNADPNYIYRVDNIFLSKDFSVGSFGMQRWTYTCSPAPTVHVSIGHYNTTVILTEPATGVFRWSVDEGLNWWPLMGDPLVSKKDVGKLLVQKSGWDVWEPCLDVEWNSALFRNVSTATPTATPTKTPTAVPNPVITGFFPNKGSAGQVFEVWGYNFSESFGESAGIPPGAWVAFDAANSVFPRPAAEIRSWTYNKIVAVVPSGLNPDLPWSVFVGYYPRPNVPVSSDFVWFDVLPSATPSPTPTATATATVRPTATPTATSTPEQRVGIWGQVFEDRNSDGRNGVLDRGMAGVQVTLKDNAGKVIAVQTTGEFGYYDFRRSRQVRSGCDRPRWVQNHHFRAGEGREETPAGEGGFWASKEVGF